MKEVLVVQDKTKLEASLKLGALLCCRGLQHHTHGFLSFPHQILLLLDIYNVCAIHNMHWEYISYYNGVSVQYVKANIVSTVDGIQLSYYDQQKEDETYSSIFFLPSPKSWLILEKSFNVYLSIVDLCGWNVCFDHFFWISTLVNVRSNAKRWRFRN